MGHAVAWFLIAGVSLGRFAAFVLIAAAAVPALAASPPASVEPVFRPSADFNLSLDLRSNRTAHGEREAYPTEQPRVPVEDALHPPRLLWNPTPTSLVKVVPSKVRYKLKF